MDPIFKVNLEGPGPYGFRVTGGVECNMPIRIALVSFTHFAGFGFVLLRYFCFLSVKLYHLFPYDFKNIEIIMCFAHFGHTSGSDTK